MSSSRRMLARASFILAAMTALVASVPSFARADEGIWQTGTIPRTGPLYVDSGARILYQVSKGTSGPDTIEMRDLDSLKIKGKLEFDLPTVSSGLTALSGQHLAGTLAAVDHVKHRLFWVHRIDGANLEVVVADGRARRVANTLQLCSPDVPAACGPTAHYGVESLAYSAAHDTLYVLYLTPIPMPGVTAAGHLAVQAIDASSGKVKWNTPISGCNSLFADRAAMQPLGRSGDHLYLACVAGNGGSNATNPSGTAAVLRFELKGDDAPGAPETYASPIVPNRGVFDPISERTFLIGGNLMTIFDGRHQVFVGLLTTGYRPLLGMNAAIGRAYLCSTTGKDVLGEPSGGLLVTDAAIATPPPPGGEFPGIKCYDGITWPIEADSVKQRVFVPLEGDLWGVVKDNSPAYAVPAPYNPDEGAQDIAERAGITESTFGGQAGAYGSRFVLIGGPIGVFDNVTPGGNVFQNFSNRAGLVFAPSSRDVRFANIPLSKLGTDGAEAIAISSDRDARFDADLAAVRQWHGEERDSLAKQTCGNASTCLDTSKTPTWPFEYSHCFAFGGDTDKPTDPQDGSKATCDFKSLRVDASATAEKPVSKDLRSVIDTLAQYISVGESTASTQIFRDKALGTVAKSTATSRNIIIKGAAGTVYIGEATATAIAHAAGHRGKAGTTFKPEFHDVKIVSGSTVVYRCTSADCIPATVIDEINQVVGPRIVARVPGPDSAFLGGSKGGTSAQVVQDFWTRTEEQALFDKPADDLTTPALELRINANILTNSGVVVQLAGVSAVATYRISLVPVAPPPPVFKPPITVTTIIPPPPDPKISVGPSGPQTTTSTIVEKVRTGVRWMMGFGHRSTSILAGWFLLLSPLVLTVRRRILNRSVLRA